MVFPVVCYASSKRTVTVQLSKKVGGTGLWLGKPNALEGTCSWFIDH